MPTTWKTVRVFISSTFRDMHAERDHLVKVVFPALRERLEKHRVHLVDIDLRWGVTREQADNDQVLDLCLQQIDECRPFFLGILGERYGWVPTRHPADALKKFGWIQQHTGKSVTELEIIHSVLQNPQMRGHAFFYFRDPNALRAVPEAIRRAVYAETEPTLIEKLKELKKRIRYSGHPVMENYPARWDPEAYDRPSRSKGRLVDLKAFGERVRDQLWQAIQAEYELPDKPPMETQVDPLAEELDYHERFMESRLRIYVGREQINRDLFAFAEGDEPVACLVTGPSGSGKSAALARFVTDYRQKHPQTLVVPHFVGASPRSTNVRDMLRRFCQIFKTRFGFAEDVPEEVAKLSVTFREFVGKIPEDTRVLLVIDALNQLDETDRAQELYWLPRELPPQVKVIVSCINDSGKSEPVLEAFPGRKHRAVQVTALSDLEQREIIRQVPSLSAKTLDLDQVRLLLSNPATANPLFLLVALEELRGFAPFERLNERIAAFPREGDTVTAIFTQVIERLAEEFNQKLVETVLTLLASARRGLSERELQELVAGLDGADDLFPVLRQLRPYLLSRAGLTDFYHRNLFKAVRKRYLLSEEQQWLAHVRLAEYFNAQDYWLESLEEQATTREDLAPTPRSANVRKVDELPWQLLEMVREAREGNLAVELPSACDCLEQLFEDIDFLEAKTQAGLIFELAAEFKQCVVTLPDDRPQRHILTLLAAALRRDIHFIHRHRQDYPQGLFQCLWNTGWWYDNRAAAIHYVGDEKTHSETPPWECAKPRLHPLLEHWRNQIASRGYRWLRSLRPPVVSLGSSQQAVFSHGYPVDQVAIASNGRTMASAGRVVRIWDVESQILLHTLELEAVKCIAFSPDGSLLAAAERSEITIWDVESWARCRVLSGQTGEVHAVAFSPDGTQLASGCHDEIIRIWRLGDGAELVSFRGHESGVSTVAYSADGKLLVSGSGYQTRPGPHEDRAVRVWNAIDGTQRLALSTGMWRVNEVTFSPDAEHIVAAAGLGTKWWRTSDGNSCLRGFLGGQECTSVAFSPSGQYVAFGRSNGSIPVTSTRDNKSFQLPGHTNSVTSVRWLPDDQHLVSGSADGTIGVWNVVNHSAPLNLSGPKGPVMDLLFSPDARHLYFRTSGKGVGYLDLEKFVFWTDLESEWVHDMALSPDGKLLAVAADEIGLMLGGRQLCGGFFERVAFSGDGRFVVAVDHTERRDPIIGLWRSSDGRLMGRWRAKAPSVCFAFSPSCNQFAFAGSDAEIQVVETAHGTPLKTIGVQQGGVRSFRFDTDEHHLAIELVDGPGKTIRWYVTDLAREVSELTPLTPNLECEVVSNNPSRIEEVTTSLVANETMFCEPTCQPTWFPVAGQVVKHPFAQVWGLAKGRQLYLIALET